MSPHRTAFRPWLACILSASVVVLLLARAAPAAPPRVPDTEAYRHIGKEATVCGRVVAATRMDNMRGRPTFLNLGAPYPGQTFTVVIWEDAQGRFETPPHLLFAGAEICVTGLVATYKEKPQIVVRNPAQIVVTDGPAFPAERFSPEERIVLKAVLSGLGFPADYSDGTWDEAAGAALRSFQASEGMEGDGDRDASTLRRLAEAAGQLPAGDATRILQLLLLNLAQRETS